MKEGNHYALVSEKWLDFHFSTYAWWIDSGTTVHVTNSMQGFLTSRPGLTKHHHGKGDAFTRGGSGDCETHPRKVKEKVRQSSAFEGPGPRNGTLRDAKVKSRSFSLYSSRFEEKLASDCKLLTYLGITFIESHRERVKRSLSVVTPL